MISRSYVTKVATIALYMFWAVIFFISCTKRVTKDTDDSILTDSIVTQLSILQDSLDNAWRVMINDDDEKIQFMKRLLDEAAYSNYNTGRYEELVQLLEELKALRYDREAMKESKLIDQYDSATSVVTRQVMEYSYDFPGFEQNNLMNELVADINLKNNYVLIYRVHYDKFAEQINEILEKHGKLLEDREIEMEKHPLFQLSPEEI